MEYDADAIPKGLYENSFTFVASQGWRTVKVTAEDEETHMKWISVSYFHNFAHRLFQASAIS